MCTEEDINHSGWFGFYLAWNPFQISLICMFHLLGKLGLAGLPFKPISRNPNTAEPITEESHRSRHVSLL